MSYRHSRTGRLHRLLNRPDFLRPEPFPYVDVQIIPKDPDAFEAAIVDVALEPLEDDDPEPYDEGSGCTGQCGYCGRCF